MESRPFELIAGLLVLSVFYLSQILPSLASDAGTGIAGVVTVGPVPDGPSIVAGSKPLANVTFVVKGENGNVIASFITDDQGQFRISLTPGHYTVSRKDARPKVGRYGPFDVEVVAGQMAQVAWSCDSGMR